MRKFSSYMVMFLLVNSFVLWSQAQNIIISGNVKNNATGENASAVSVVVKSTGEGTYTDDKGNFTLHVKSLPVTLEFTSVSFQKQEKEVTAPTSSLQLK